MVVDIQRLMQFHINWIAWAEMSAPQPFTAIGSKAPWKNLDFLSSETILSILQTDPTHSLDPERQFKRT
jgi:hypothetical protein